jgi:uncharacterized protein YdeI (YjbR/CyaY-like superfamily)
MKEKNSRIDGFIARSAWVEEMESLRRIALQCGLDEELKWGKPCYSFEGGNVAIIQGFKDQCALMFFKGALLQDPDGLLERPGANSHVARRMVFAGIDDVVANEVALRGFIGQAIELEEAGAKVDVPKNPEPIPDELDAMFAEVAGLEDAFGELTPGRQRGYILHFSGAKQSSTRISRIEKCVDRILEGKGLRD